MNTKPAQLLVIDPQVADYQHLAAGIQPGVQLLILDPDRDGIEQITEYLTGERMGSVGSVGSVGSNLPPLPPLPTLPPLPHPPHPPSLHIISHGSPGRLYLGNSTLELNNLEQYRPQLEKWGIAHLYIYGCKVAAGDAGAEFLQKLYQITQTQIYANPHPTGNAALGGTWELQPIQSPPAPLPPCSPALLHPHTLTTYPGILLEPEYAWAKNLGGSSNDYGNSIAIDSSGNTYTTGWFSGTVDFDPGPGVANLTSAGLEDIFITKLDANGNYVWAKNLGSSSTDSGSSIAIDSSGSTYTTGSFSGTADFDPGAGTAYLTSAGFDDIFISKLDANGNYVWAKNLGSSSNTDYGVSIAIDSSGNTYTTGWFSGTADFDPGAGTANLTSAGSFDIFITKLDANGNYVWAKNLGGSSGDEGNSITIDSSGNTYTTGSFSGTADFDPGAGTANLTSAGSADIFISKLDANGNYVWAKNLGGSSTDDGYSIAIDSSGNTYTTGSFWVTADFDPGTGTANLTSAGYSDIFISKLDANGNYVWAKNLGGSSGDYGYSIAIDSSGNTYTTGYFNGTADFDPGTGTANLTSAGVEDIFITKLDANGNYVWAKNLGGSDYDGGKSIAIDSSGNTYTTGYFNGTADFDPGTGTANLTSAGSYDIFISKLTPGVAPTVTNITSSQTDGSYTTSTLIPITVTFSEPVNVTGTPSLTLNTGATATYSSGSGTNTLTFNYTVGTSENSPDLDYSSTTALTLNGGTIQDGATNNADLTLPTPGATNSLGANKNLIIDTTPPTVTIEQAGGQTDPATASPINYTVTFSETVTGFDAADISFTGSTAGGTLTPIITGTGTTYNVAVSGMTTSGTVVPSVIANAATDAVGNPSAASTSTDNTVTYNTIPTVSNINKTGNEDNNITFTAADFTAAFSDVDNDSLNKIQITSLPANGTLQLSGGNVTLNQEILTANIPNLIFIPAADYNGNSSFTWNGSDGSNYAPTAATANLTINPVNDVPSFSNSGNQTLTTWTNTTQTVNNWANTFSFGPPDENSQTVADFLVNVTSGNTLFTTLADIANDGTLTYTPNGTPGTATVQVQLQDNGGVANGGIDTSAAATFNIIIPPPTVNLSVNTTTGTEAGTTAITITATAPGPVVGNQTLNLALSGTASNSDFSSTIPTQITIADRTTSGQITLNIANDFLDEGDETATFTISNPTAGILLGTTTTQTITITDDGIAGITIIPTTGLATTEAGGTDTFTVVLNTQPTADVTINLTSDNPAEGTVNQPSLTFTPANWNTAQTVTVTGVDDLVADGDIAYNIITAPATSTDVNYNGVDGADVVVSNSDNETPGITITPTSGLATTEAGGTATFTVVLNTQPTADVTINLTSDNTAEGTVNQTSLTFTPANWNTAQTVTVTGVDDLVADRDIAYNIITTPATSADANYNGMDGADVTVTNTDDDSPVDNNPPDSGSPETNDGLTTPSLPPAIFINHAPGVGVIPPVQRLDVIEGGGEDIYELSLATQPANNIDIAIITDDQTTVNVPSVTFTPDDWNIPQVVRVSAVDDDVVEGFHRSRIRFVATSLDRGYHNFPIGGLIVNIADNENVGWVRSLPTPTNLMATGSDDNLVGSSGRDVMNGRQGQDDLEGGDGNDVLSGAAGADYISGGVGFDQILGGEGEDYVDGGDDDDVILAGRGSDRIYGGSGNDKLFGEAGDDYLWGGEGADTLTGVTGRDVFAIGNGTGGMTLEMADVITDFVSGEDVIDLMPPLGLADLNMVQNGADAVIQNRVTGEFLAVVKGVDVLSLSPVDFV